MKGPLDRGEIPYADIKVHSMAAKLKPTGKVRSIIDCSGPYTEFEGTPGFVYDPDYPGSLNSTIQKSEFLVNLTSLAEFVNLLWDHGLWGRDDKTGPRGSLQARSCSSGRLTLTVREVGR